MHTRIMLAILAGVVSAGAAAAQTPADRFILQPSVEVRSGPSDAFYPTSQLLKGDKVTVVGEAPNAPGWLEIVPPPKSFSWINAKYVQRSTADPRLGRVETTAPVMPGSCLVGQAPNRESLKVAPGIIVVIVAKEAVGAGETYLPIEPQPKEVRYIPASAVQPATTVGTNVSPPTWQRTPDGYEKDPYLAEADKQLAAGNSEQAKQLYQYVANTATNPSNKQYAANRLASLTQSPNTPVQATTTSLSPAKTAPTPPLNLQTLKPPEWSPYGRLRDIKYQREDGQAIYVLEDAQGRVIGYVSTDPPKSLQSYLGRWVAVYGPTMYRDSGVRMQYIVATHVAQP